MPDDTTEEPTDKAVAEEIVADLQAEGHDVKVVEAEEASFEAPEEMVEAALESNKALNENKEPATGVGVLRTKGTSQGKADEMYPSEIPYPKEAHGEDFEYYGPQGYAAQIPEGTEIAPYSAEQEFIIDPQRVEVLHFTRPGQNLPKKRLYTVKALHLDGRLVQLPFEAQIQNTAGGDPEDAIGLRRYQRKGITLLIDWDTLTPIYCAAWGCWAQAVQGGDFPGFCAMRHAQHTLPNRFKDAGNITRSLMEQGVTTSRIWSG